MAQTITVKGKIYQICPFNTGQMRRHVDPSVKRTIALFKQKDQIDGMGPDAIMAVALETNEIRAEQAELVVMAMQNGYPKFELEDLDELAPVEVAEIFSQIMQLTQAGGRLGEVPAPIVVKKIR